MSTEIVKANNQIVYNNEQLDLIKKTIAKGATDNELQLFLYQCQKSGLDPLAKQIYFVKYNTKDGPKVNIITSIDGLRIIAQRSKDYAGQDEPIFEEKDGVIIKCKVSVFKWSPNNERYCAAVGVAYYKEYYPNPERLQKTMPHVMISKVAEALALRKAFPNDMSGLYTSEEMEQAELRETKTAPQKRAEVVTKKLAEQATRTEQQETEHNELLEQLAIIDLDLKLAETPEQFTEIRTKIALLPEKDRMDIWKKTVATAALKNVIWNKETKEFQVKETKPVVKNSVSEQLKTLGFIYDPDLKCYGYKDEMKWINVYPINGSGTFNITFGAMETDYMEEINDKNFVEMMEIINNMLNPKSAKDELFGAE